jgi:DtxR family transcriptional regulator, Mn-dependent transcriptional regulator
MSEHTEMYLITMARLRRADRPVPVTLLAQDLMISPVSANEMCRRLAGRGLIDYQPYKGVTLTEAGEALVQRLLCRRRLWEVLLVEKLGMNPAEAEAIACRFEHVTPDSLSERLRAFLDYPTHSPQGEPIPSGATLIALPTTRSLTALHIGEQARVQAIDGEVAAQAFLHTHGIIPGTALRMLGIAEDTLLIEANGHAVALAHAIAAGVHVVAV